jgi:hypothetical protein
VDKETYPGSQQQWFTRNSVINSWANGVWNHVFVGVQGAPPAHCSDTGANPYTVVGTTPTIAEKPFLTADPSTGLFSLNIPGYKTNSVGIDWSTGSTVGFDSVYVANNATDTSDRFVSVGLFE